MEAEMPHTFSNGDENTPPFNAAAFQNSDRRERNIIHPTGDSVFIHPNSRPEHHRPTESKHGKFSYKVKFSGRLAKLFNLEVNKEKRSIKSPLMPRPPGTYS